MSDFCEDHEYHYAGDECPFCKQSVGFSVATDVESLYAVGDETPVACTHGTVRVQTDDGEYVTASTCDIGSGDINDGGTISTPLTGECQEPDRDTFVELATSEELRRIEEEFHESSQRLRHLTTIIAHAEALERLYDDDQLVERQVAQETRLKAEQLRGAVSDD